MSKKNEEQEEQKVHITWWRQVGEFSRIYPYIDLEVLAKGGRWNMGSDGSYRAIRLWERSAEHSKMAVVLNLMEGAQKNDECTSYVLGVDEVLSVMGWDKLPGFSGQSTTNIGEVWVPSEWLGRIVYPGEGENHG